MKIMQRAIGATFIAVTLVLAAGCDTPLGQIVGNIVTVNGQPANEFFKGVLAQMDAQQQASLQAESPQTLQTLQHNDQVAKQQAAATAAPGQPTPPSEAPTPLTVNDIKALTAAGLKKEAIIDAIKESKTTYSPADIEAAQQATPPVDPAVVEYMKNPTS